MNRPDSDIVWKNETKSERENTVSGDDIFNDSIVLDVLRAQRRLRLDCCRLEPELRRSIDRNG